MTLDEWRAQGAEDCRSMFAEHAVEFTELCKGGRSDVVLNSILLIAGAKAVERTGSAAAIEDGAAFLEGFLAAADAEVVVMTNKLPITVTDDDDNLSRSLPRSPLSHRRMN